MTALVQGAGPLAALLLLAGLLWSIRYPGARLWPPRDNSALTGIVAWGLTLAIFGAVLWLGIADWGRFPLPIWIRYGLGGGLIVLGNLAVWSCVRSFGIAQTSGAVGRLQRDGLYKWSRHPQYVADMGILMGWTILSVAPLAWPLCAIGILLLMVAARCEEPWLAQTYPNDWPAYAAKTRRFI